MKRRLFSIPILLILTASALTGCVKLQKTYPEKRYFVLDVKRAEVGRNKTKAKVLKINRFKISPFYEGKNVVVRLGDFSYQSDFYNEFFISPAAMITHEVGEWLSDSGLFEIVSLTSGLPPPDYVLEGAITLLHADYRRFGEAKAVMELQFFLIPGRGDKSEILFYKTYHQELAFQERTPDRWIEKLIECFEIILADFENDLKNVPMIDTLPDQAS